MATITFLCWFNAYQMYISVMGNANGYTLTDNTAYSVYVIGETPSHIKFCEDDRNE